MSAQPPTDIQDIEEELTQKQLRFAYEYPIDLNGTQAAIRAGYSEKTAAQQAARLLNNVKIQQVIESRIAEHLARTNENAYSVFRELKSIGHLDLRDVLEWGPDGVRLKPSDEIPEEAAKAISQITVTPTKNGPRVELKAHDKNRALEMLAKYFGFLTDSVDVNVSGSVEHKHGHIHLHEDLEQLEDEDLSDEERAKRAVRLYQETVADS
ncbi:MAG: terminase small subunit [Salinibacter sp.]